MTLQQLLYFQVACRYQNISRAAEFLHISQPSVSGAIKNLEEEFEVRLIQRQRVGFQLTSDGEEFLAYAESLLEHAEHMKNVMKEKRSDTHRVRLGMPPMAGAILFPRIYKDFCVNHPEVELVTQEAGKNDLLKLLKEDLLDMAVVPYSDNLDEDYFHIPVMCPETQCCVSVNHPFASKDVIRPEELEREPIVVFEKGFYHNERILREFDKKGVTPKIMHTSSQLSTVEQLISDQIAAGFLFKELADKTEGIRGISFDPPIITMICLVWKKEHYIFREMKLLIDYFEKNKNAEDGGNILCTQKLHP